MPGSIRLLAFLAFTIFGGSVLAQKGGTSGSGGGGSGVKLSSGKLRALDLFLYRPTSTSSDPGDQISSEFEFGEHSKWIDYRSFNSFKSLREKLILLSKKIPGISKFHLFSKVFVDPKSHYIPTIGTSKYLWHIRSTSLDQRLAGRREQFIPIAQYFPGNGVVLISVSLWNQLDLSSQEALLFREFLRIHQDVHGLDPEKISILVAKVTLDSPEDLAKDKSFLELVAEVEKDSVRSHKTETRPAADFESCKTNTSPRVNARACSMLLETSFELTKDFSASRFLDFSEEPLLDRPVYFLMKSDGTLVRRVPEDQVILDETNCAQ